MGRSTEIKLLVDAGIGIFLALGGIAIEEMAVALDYRVMVPLFGPGFASIIAATGAGLTAAAGGIATTLGYFAWILLVPERFPEFMANPLKWSWVIGFPFVAILAALLRERISRLEHGQLVKARQRIAELEAALRNTQAEVANAGVYDPLTGLPGKRLLADRLAHAVAEARRTVRPVGVLHLGLNGLGAVHESHGPEAVGDVLRQLALRIKLTLREVDTVSRAGENEYVVVLSAPEGREAIEQVALRLLGTVGLPCQLGAATATVTASIGGAVFPEDGDDPGTLRRRATELMHDVRKVRRAGVRFCEQSVR